MPRLGLVSSLTGGAVAESFVNTYSIYFDGTDDYIDIGDHQLITTEGTISAWIKIDNFSTNEYVLSKNHIAGGSREYEMLINANKYAVFIVIDDHTGGYTADTVATGTTTLSADTWYHIVGTTHDTNKTKVYVNGLIEGTSDTAVATVGDGSAPLVIGKTTGGTQTNGFIDEVAIWDVELDADAIAAVYNSGTPFNLTKDKGNYNNSGDLVGYWRFEEGTGPSAADSSTNGNTGTLKHDATWSTDVPS